MTALHLWQLAKKRLERFLAEFVNPGDEVHLAHVIPEAKETLTVGMAGALSSTLGGSGRASTESAQEQGERRIKQAKEDMQNNYVPVLTARNVPFEVAILVTPSKTKAIGETLTNYATRVNATALALGKSDRSKVQELFLGSVFKVVLDKTTTNVIVLA
ncbi:hypothetical protein QBZ16_000531 [Prototheca wickerhamii]|uniref:UspA domain-containing protein n=1 Tax=Prototheca wickerhamii TaxID=3111 RepID=A0AAD9IPI4_PROWI|nr:hypothetical protein QBZ16_000531 [Prototheca wickerhamii]